jgi:hypothetical protein
VVHADGYATVTLSADSSVSASGGFNVGVLSAGVGVSSGDQLTYEVRMRDEDFERLQRGELPPPHPLAPSTLPDGASVRLEQSQLAGTSMRGGLNALGLRLSGSSEITEGEGLMLEMARTGDSVRVTAGPRGFIENEGSIKVGAGVVSVESGRTDSLTDYQLRTATFDLARPEGQAAFDAFRTTGQLPEADGPGVSNALHLERLRYESQGELGVGLGPLELSIEGQKNTVDALLTHHPDGTTTRSVDVEYGEGDFHPDLNIQQRFDAAGQLIPGTERYTYAFDMANPSFRESMAYSFLGLDDEALAQGQAAHDSQQPLTLTLTPEDVRQLQEAARAGHSGLSSLLHDHAGNPLEPMQAARLLAGSAGYGQTDLAQAFSIITNGGDRPLPGTFQVGG